ncbi:MAG TPA: cbb3-type cytochrome c oxidase subunit I [Casimicrobiaceae bacterium]|nr:cbb3-type cytochrome c oxidase subunit I [Casimicrobiaceae bacterium]
MNATESLPNALPRPPDELPELQRVWAIPRGFRILTEYNNNVVGGLYVATAFIFFVLAGVLALLMRVQLAVPDNTLVGPELYNQLFTMHGTVMMFLFAVPVVEAMGITLLPNMLGARDMPFPRLSAYAFWAYAIGGFTFFCSLFVGLAPTGGWFMYPPLTTSTYSPGINEDFWLLGIGFIEISAIAGAIEIIVGIMRTRAPGMTLERMPVFVWAMLIFALMVVFAFPAVILATALLELERAFGWPLFTQSRGGDPLLWQHLFWFFGHPEVYIIFLPAAGMVSMIVPTMVRAPLVASRLVVLALVTTAFLSFGLWVHHMFATGIPHVSLAFFEAASMAVAVPSGIQVFAWIATIAAGRARLATPLLFVLGFLFVFVIGGLTGVMVAVIPFDWQAHDSYFIVAHLHYVLIGGMVFPLFAAIYYWVPFASKHALSERIGRWVFVLLFIGTNLTFFPMHVTGLAGMPRRVHVYGEATGWGTLNFASTIGAFIIAAAVALFLFDFARKFRFASEDNAGNVWDAGTLEWLPNGNYSNRSTPEVASAYPLWDQPRLAENVEEGRYYLPNAATGRRETLVTHPISARPQALLRMPPPGWAPFIAAVATAAFFMLLTVKLNLIAFACGALAIGALMYWAWELDPAPLQPVPIGAGIDVPVYLSGRMSTSWWAMVVLMLVSGSLYACTLSSYAYLWLVVPQGWPARDALPSLAYAIAAVTMIVASSAMIGLANRRLARDRDLAPALLLGLMLLVGGLGVEGYAHRGLDPAQSGYAAIVWVIVALGAVEVFAVVALGAFALARFRLGRIDRVRRNVFDNMRIFFYYVAAQTLVGIALVHVFPRFVSA